jgi:hypothetical protein
MWELIEPLDEEGEGTHHVAVATPNFAPRGF